MKDTLLKNSILIEQRSHGLLIPGERQFNAAAKDLEEDGT